MSEQEIGCFLMINEPVFDFAGKQYSVCCPDETFATWDSDGNVFDFEDINSLLNNWIVGGKPFRNSVENILLQFNNQ